MYNTEKIARDLVSRRIADQLSPHDDNQFLAFSTEVLDRMNQKHKPSSSPFTTLAEHAERKVVIIGAGQPTVYQRHDSELMHIMPSSGHRSVL